MEANEPDRSRGRILLIDAAPALAGYFSRVLRARGGFEVVHEPDAAAGLRRIEGQSWDLLLTDIEMPGMTGLELLDRVRQLVPELPGGALSARAHGRWPRGPGPPRWTTRSPRCAARPRSPGRSRSPPRCWWPRPPSWSRRA